MEPGSYFHRFLEHLIRHNNGGVAVHDKQMRYLFVSEHYLKQYHIKGNIIGKNHYEVFPDLPEKWKAVHKRVLHGESLSGDDDPYEKANGNVEFTRWACHPWYEENGAIGGIIVYTNVITKEKKTREALLSNEMSFKRAIDFAQTPVFIFTGGRFAYINSAGCRLFGCDTPESLLGDAVTKHFHPDHENDLKKRIRQLQEDKIPVSESFVLRLLRLDGKTLWIDSIGEPITFQGKAGGLVFFYDITRRIDEESALRKSEQTFRGLFMDHSAIKMLIDPKNGKIVEANRAAAKFYGWAPDVLRTMNIDEINTLSFQNIKQAMGKASRTRAYQFHFKHRTAGGDIRDVEVFSSPVNYHGQTLLHSIIHDVTEKYRIQARLALMGRTVEESPVSISITDKQGQFEYVNASFSRMFGYSGSEILGQSVKILRSEEHPQSFYDQIWEAVLSGKEWSGETLNKNKGGGFLWTRTYIFPILADEGTVMQIVTIKEDITEYKSTLDELRMAKEKAEESEKLKSAFLANVSHEIRTPMNGIMGFMELLQKPNLSNEQKDKFFQIINQSGERLLATINDLVEISKIEAGQLEVYQSDVNLRELLMFHYEFFLPQAQAKGLLLTLDMPELSESSVITTDRNKLSGALTNLLKNAIKFTSSGDVVFGCQMADGGVLFYFNDTGIGIPHDRQKAVFERFVQADTRFDRDHEGSGLGLAITRAHIEAMGGRVWLESEPGKGSNFYFYIPVSEKLTNDESRTENMPEPVIKSERCTMVLIAEDDQASFEYLEAILNKEGIRTQRAKNGLVAVEAIRNNPTICMVLMDIKMPVMDGLEATRQIRRFNQRIPIVAQTAYAFDADREMALSAGCNDYISKPISRSSLIGLLNAHL